MKQWPDANHHVYICIHVYFWPSLLAHWLPQAPFPSRPHTLNMSNPFARQTMTGIQGLYRLKHIGQTLNIDTGPSPGCWWCMVPLIKGKYLYKPLMGVCGPGKDPFCALMAAPYVPLLLLSQNSWVSGEPIRVTSALFLMSGMTRSRAFHNGSALSACLYRTNKVINLSLDMNVQYISIHRCRNQSCVWQSWDWCQGMP